MSVSKMTLERGGQTCKIEFTDDGQAKILEGDKSFCQAAVNEVKKKLG